MFAKTSDQRSMEVVAEALPPMACPYFQIYRADEVSLTSTLFGGGDWRWRLCAAVGVVIAQGGGYDTELACKSAVASLREAAQSAVIVAA
jgi:uncharacterized protein YegP (UPF0339 family)